MSQALCTNKFDLKFSIFKVFSLDLLSIGRVQTKARPTRQIAPLRPFYRRHCLADTAWANLLLSGSAHPELLLWTANGADHYGYLLWRGTGRQHDGNLMSCRYHPSIVYPKDTSAWCFYLSAWIRFDSVGNQSGKCDDYKCDLYGSHQSHRPMDVQGEMFIDYMPFHTTGNPSWLQSFCFICWWEDTRYALVRVSSFLYLQTHKNTQVGANYHVVHGAGKTASQAWIRSKGQFILLFHCLECCNSWTLRWRVFDLKCMRHLGKRFSRMTIFNSIFITNTLFVTITNQQK